MNEQTIELINQLAGKLGTSTEILIGWFAIRAPYEFVSVGITFVILIIGISLLLRSAYLLKLDEGDPDIGFGYMVAGFVITPIGFIGFAVSLYKAMIAIASPEAYAIQEILRMIGI